MANVKPTYLFKTSFRLRCILKTWKVVVMIPKPEKPPNEVTTCRPISILLVILKLSENVLLKKMKLLMAAKNLVPSHHFRFSDNHSFLDLFHRKITDILKRSLEGRKVCSSVSLDGALAFDEVWKG